MNIPVLHVSGRTLAEGYERAICALYKNGCEIKTQYDKEGDPLSKDCTLNLVVEQPAADPMIHKAFPGGISDLREYVYELHGAKDEWVKNVNDSQDTRWEYTYHGRLIRYGQWKESAIDSTGKPESKWIGPEPINQIDWVVRKLCAQPFTRQAQLITWIPHLDLECYDPPCLQSIWLRILEDTAGGWWLNTNIRFRSNDAWGASFMNMFGLMQLVQTVAQTIHSKTGRQIQLGRLNWQADSYHIYGKDIASCRKTLIDKIDAGAPFEKRCFNFHDAAIQEMYHECEAGILAKIKKTEEDMRESFMARKS
jgi:thymidylate synthase